MKALFSRIIIFGYDIDLLKSFYIENFHLTVIEETPHEWVVLNTGGVQIALHRVGEAYRDVRVGTFKATTNTKLVFSIEGNLKALRQKLLDNGVAVGDVKSFTGTNSLFCDGEDPEGNVFQLQEGLD